MASENTDRILTVLSQIPPGRVATYGQIAKLAGLPRNARQVGVILSKLQDPSIPWYRVVNSRGEISCRGSAENESIQKAALQEENVVFDSQGRISLSEFGWHPGSPAK